MDLGLFKSKGAMCKPKGQVKLLQDSCFFGPLAFQNGGLCCYAGYRIKVIRMQNLSQLVSAMGCPQEK